MTKRKKFVVSGIILLLGIVAIRYPFLQWRFRIIIYSLMAGLLSFWGLHDRDLTGIKRFTVTAPPAFFALGSALVFPLLPPVFENFLVWPISYDTGIILALGLRLVFLGIFGIGYYAAMLCGNIFNVASIRTIQLLRAAHSVGLVITLATVLSFYLIVSSFHLSSFFNMLLVFIISVPLILNTLWAVNLDEKIGKREMVLSVFLAAVIAELSWAVSFWPLTVSVWALFLVASFYVATGITQYLLSDKLFPTTVREFIIVSLAIFALVIFTASWSG